MITILQGDITKQSVDAIVNAAKPSLLGGGGVDGAIHRAAGRALYEECFDIPLIPDRLVDVVTRYVAGSSAPSPARDRVPVQSDGVRCLVGQARATRGHELSADWVVHTVGPIYNPNYDSECEELLESAYERSLLLAQMLGCRTVALPAISCGVYGYPLNRAAEIAIRVASRPCWHFDEIRFVLFPDDVFKAFDDALFQSTVPAEEQPPPF